MSLSAQKNLRRRVEGCFLGYLRESLKISTYGLVFIREMQYITNKNDPL
jgi:hypothetical protein